LLCRTLRRKSSPSMRMLHLLVNCTVTSTVMIGGVTDFTVGSEVWHSFSHTTRKCGNYSDVLPLKAARRDSINSEGGKTSGPVLSHLWTKVLEILRQCRRPFALSNALARLSVSHFVQHIFAIKCRSRRKTEQM